jgi:long-chain fatty acid transport protein
MRVFRTLALSGVATAALASQAHAAGFFLQEQSVRGTGRAYSGEVADQGLESLWWNPASIARSPREAYVGASGILVQSRVENSGSTITYPGGVTLPVGGDVAEYNPIQNGISPNFSIATPVLDRFAVGLSLTAPFNFETRYRQSSFARYDALRSRLNTGDLQLTGAMKVIDWLDLGVGLDIQYTDAKLQNALPNLSPALPDGISQLSGNGWNVGWTVGAQAHFDKLSLGASYRSATDHSLSGTEFIGGLLGPLAAGNVNLPATAKFATPWIATIGARYRLTDQLTLNAQVQRFGWSRFRNIEVTAGGVTQALPQDYKDTTSGGVGADYAVNDRLTLRAGVQYDPTPTPGGQRSARVPDSNRWLYAIGATGRVTDRIKVDAGFAYIDFGRGGLSHDTIFYPGTPAAITTDLRGVVKGDGYVLALGLRTEF